MCACILIQPRALQGSLRTSKKRDPADHDYFQRHYYVPVSPVPEIIVHSFSIPASCIIDFEVSQNSRSFSVSLHVRLWRYLMIGLMYPSDFHEELCCPLCLPHTLHRGTDAPGPLIEDRTGEDRAGNLREIVISLPILMAGGRGAAAPWQRQARTGILP